jgi:dihydroneopterin aldolase
LEGLDDRDRIRICGIDVLGHHGVDEAEREVGQRLIIDLELFVDLQEAIDGDDIRKTVNYEAVCGVVEKVASEEEFLLLESLADKIARCVLDRFAPLEVVVRVKKPNLPITTRVESVEVEVRRHL